MLRSSSRGAAGTDRKTIFGNASWNVLRFSFQVGIALVVAPILIHGLGEETYGIWSLVEQIVAYFALLELGIGASVVRYVARFEELGDRSELNRVFNTTLALFSALGSIALIGIACLAYFLGAPATVPSEHQSAFTFLLIALGLVVALDLYFGVFGSVLVALGRFPARVGLEIGTAVLSAALSVAIVLSGNGLKHLGVALVTVALVRGIGTTLLVHYYVPTLCVSVRFVEARTLRLIRGYSVQAFIGQIAGRISFGSDAIVIGLFLLPENVTYFVVANRLIAYAKELGRAFTGVLTPAISALEARGDAAAIQRTLIDGSRYMLHLAILLELGILTFGHDFLRLWLGSYIADRSVSALIVLAFPLASTFVSSVVGRILYGIGDLRRYVVTVSACAVANLVLSVILIQKWGIVGVAWGTTVPLLVQDAILLRHACNVLRLPLTEYCRKALLIPLALGVGPLLVWHSLSTVLDSRTLSGLAMTAFAGCLVYAILLGLVEFRGQLAVATRRILNRG